MWKLELVDKLPRNCVNLTQGYENETWLSSNCQTQTVRHKGLGSSYSSPNIPYLG